MHDQRQRRERVAQALEDVGLYEVCARGGGPGGTRQAAANTGPVWDTLVVEMQQNSLAEMDKDAEPSLYRAILKAKSLSIFRVIKSVVGADRFIEGVGTFDENNKQW